MMNRSSSAEAYFAPSMMSFVALEGSSQKHQTWDWETSSIDANTTTPVTTSNLQSHPFFPSVPLLDCAPPPLLPMTNSFPFYPPPPLPEYPVALIKREDGVGGRIGLNLGRRTYFSSGEPLTTRGAYSFSHQPPRCQAEGCRADLSGAKHYHRRHKVCEFHSKAAVVVVGGSQQRFCQQCSRFHGLAEFDEAKRSCRKRLADHNRRRRKPQPPATMAEPSAPGNTNASSRAQKTTGDSSNLGAPIPLFYHQQPLALMVSPLLMHLPLRNWTASTEPTAAVCTTNASTMVGPEGQQHQDKGQLLRNGPAFSRGGVAAGEGDMGPDPMYQTQGHFVESSSSPSASNAASFRHHNLFP
ncbi:transcription, DNA-dependent [Musa troglodytarum]|uniref:Transcription, DNA-dependent n=1 Tax=Musa troglodytarum TaxID=320322 RepID=A0A9E7FBZ3_9LILI|nr:transcription, DNA-dependent [Musa troglodytarum]